jgi:hypothetical protein
MEFPEGAFGSLRDALSVDSISTIPLKWKKKPGPRWKTLGFTSKREAWDGGARKDTENTISSLLRGELRAPWPASAGGRAKLSTKAKAATTAGLGRLVWEMDVVDVAVGTLIITPINEWLSSHPNITSIGKTFLFNGGLRHARHFGYDKRPNQLGVGTDARKLDSSLLAWLVREIINRFRRGFTDGADPIYDVLWTFLADLHVGGRVFMPDNAFYQVCTGSCSGAPFVSLLECYYTAYCHLYGLTDLLMSRASLSFHRASRIVHANIIILALGDDNWFTSRCPEFLEVIWDLAAFRSVSKRRFDLDIHLHKSYQGRGLDSFYYLSKSLSGAVPTRSLATTLERWKYPERLVSGPEASYERTAGLMLDNPILPAYEILASYLDFLEQEYNVDPSSLEFAEDYTALTAGISLRRFEYGEILNLYFVSRAKDDWFGGPLKSIV